MRAEFSIGLMTLGRETFGEMFDEYFDERREVVAKAATYAMRQTGDTAKRRVRSEVRRRFRRGSVLSGNSDFANSFRSYDYPNRKRRDHSRSIRPAVELRANASWAHIFEEGGTVVPSSAAALAIPTETAEKYGLDRGPKFESTNRWEGHRSQVKKAARIFGGLDVVPDPDGRGAFLVAKDDGGESLFLFKLVRSVREPRKLSLRRSAAWAMRFLQEEFNDGIARHGG